MAQPLNLTFSVLCNAMNSLIKFLKSNESVIKFLHHHGQKKTIIQSLSDKIKSWKRYVDDTIAIKLMQSRTFYYP